MIHCSLPLIYQMFGHVISHQALQGSLACYVGDLLLTIDCCYKTGSSLGIPVGLVLSASYHCLGCCRCSHVLTGTHHHQQSAWARNPWPCLAMTISGTHIPFEPFHTESIWPAWGLLGESLSIICMLEIFFALLSCVLDLTGSIGWIHWESVVCNGLLFSISAVNGSLPLNGMLW